MKRLFILYFVLFYSCLSGRVKADYKHIGTISTLNKQILVKLYIENDFWLSNRSIEYEVIDKTNNSNYRFHLLSILDYEKNTDNFHLTSFGNIVFLSYRDTSKLYAIYDVNTHIGYPSPKIPNLPNEHIDSIILSLQQKGVSFKPSWLE